MADTNLSKNILATLCYYDCLNFPLTAFEVWKNMTVNSEQRAMSNEGGRPLREVIKELDSGNLAVQIEEFRGFYFLKGRKDLVNQRLKRNKISVEKIKKLRKYIKISRFIPFVRMIALTGRLAMKNTEAKSDWDVLVVFQKGKIWTGRTLMTLLFQILGKRRHGNKIQNRICLNHFITTESLKINLQDLFSAHEYSWIIPIFDTGFFNKFQIRNSWIRDYRPNYCLSDLYPKGIITDSKVTLFVRRWLEKMISSNWIETNLRVWQKKKIARNPKTNQAGSYIEATDEALVFLPEPQGPKVYECYMDKLKEFNMLTR